MDQFLAASAVGLDGGLKSIVLTIVWVIAVGLGVWEYSRSKGRIGKALMTTLGGGLLLTFVISPGIITDTVPSIFQKVIDWLGGAAKK